MQTRSPENDELREMGKKTKKIEGDEVKISFQTLAVYKKLKSSKEGETETWPMKEDAENLSQSSSADGLCVVDKPYSTAARSDESRMFVSILVTLLAIWVSVHLYARFDAWNILERTPVTINCRKATEKCVKD